MARLTTSSGDEASPRAMFASKDREFLRFHSHLPIGVWLERRSDQSIRL
jgi:hypothetical protein